jgi:spore germination protein GerM
VLVIAFLICALVLGALILKKYELGNRKPQSPPQGQQHGILMVTLFFASPDGSSLEREGREIDACDGLSECVGDVVGELINGPVGNLNPALPSATTLNGVIIDGDRAVVDLGEGFGKGLPGGSNSEMLAVYSIVDTIAVNFPKIKLVRLLINGQAVETLNGHLDLTEPLAPDFDIEKK